MGTNSSEQTDLVTPSLHVYIMGCNKKLMSIGPILWKDFAYFRVLMRQNNYASIDINLQMILRFF